MSPTSVSIFRTLTTQTVASRLSAEALCCAENRARCMSRFLEMPNLSYFNKPTSKSAGILVPLCIDDGRLSLLYTVRSSQLSRHRNEISFPGGIRDESDASWAACAVREAQEECGIHPDQIDVWGECRLIQTHAEMAVMPVIGFVNDFNLDRLRINPDEVAEVFTVPLEVLCDPSNMRHTQFRLNRTGYSVTAFLGGRYRVWGLTGGLTHLLLTSLLPDDLYGKRNVPFVRPLRV